MIQSLKPNVDEIRALALAETDPVQVHRFEPFCLGFLGNGLIIILAGCAGLMHGLFRWAFRAPRSR